MRFSELTKVYILCILIEGGEYTMPASYRRKLFDHGGSKALNLPKEAYQLFGDQEITVEVQEDGVFIYLDTFANLESDPNFHLFVNALVQDAMQNPDQLKNLEDVWDKEWDELLDGIDGGEEV